MNPRTRTWAADLMERLNIPARLAAPIVEAGSIIGPIHADVAAGSTALAGTPVVASASHDTASAVAAITARDGTAFISSGTWSLVGTELDEPVLTPRAMQLNFSNEGGVAGTTRLLKNVMGLWLLQGCRRSWAQREPSVHVWRADGCGRARAGAPPPHRSGRCRRSRTPMTCRRRSIVSAGEPISLFRRRRAATPEPYSTASRLKYRLVIRDLAVGHRAPDRANSRHRRRLAERAPQPVDRRRHWLACRRGTGRSDGARKRRRADARDRRGRLAGRGARHHRSIVPDDRVHAARRGRMEP